MGVNKLFGAVLAASVAFTPVAAVAAQPVGSIVSVNGDAFVSRDGRLVRAQPNMAVKTGDRVITRNGATANVALNNCSLNVAGGQMTSISNGSCGSTQTASFDRAGSTAKDSSQLAGGGGFIVAILAAAAVIVGIVVVAQNDDDSPTSP